METEATNTKTVLKYILQSNPIYVMYKKWPT